MNSSTFLVNRINVLRKERDELDQAVSMAWILGGVCGAIVTFCACAAYYVEYLR